MAVEGLNLSQVTTALYTGEYPNAWAANLATLTQKGLPVGEFAKEVSRVTDGYVTAQIGNSGNVIGYSVKGYPQITVQPTIPNSNNATIARGTIAAPVSTTVNPTNNTAILSRLSGVGTKIATSTALIGTAAMCVGAGITLGKTFDGALYNLNPDFFNSIGMSSLNPETWNAITAGNDSLGASVLNVLFGFDENGNGQAYIDENALAYFASWMNQAGVFNSGEEIKTDEYNTGAVYPLSISTVNWVNYKYGSAGQLFQGVRYSDNVKVCFLITPSSSSAGVLISASKTPYMYQDYYISSIPTPPNAQTYNNNASQRTFNGETFYTTVSTFGHGNTPYPMESNNTTVVFNSLNVTAIAYQMLFESVTSIVGIGTQPGATTPQNLTGDPTTDLELLRNQYPNVFNNGIDYPVIQPDGTVKNYHYVPVNLPDTFERVETQPESGTATQTDTEINPSTAPQELVNTLTKILTNPLPETKTELENNNPPENPTDTGEGSSPIPIIPVGSASALWKIYHPTQAQIDLFGGWLWSSAFVDQLLKIFNNPMESIIGLHKVYATPIDAGNTTIKVGYLDSQVPSAYIEEQYITVDCGSVDLYEVFGNVFDYSPFTDVNLYLPFVGIVRLDVSDVMRSTISIKYGVDILTGACLAMVTVSRDGYDSILYQYSGNCAVQYPISSGSYMGIVSSIISVAGGVAATIATGGGAAPLALGVAGGAMSAHTNIQHSGSFSGNAGAMGGKIPYLIISRPQTKLNSRYSEMEGTPNNHYITVGECSGYIEARAVHVINVNATDSELDEIQSLLMNGIII